MWIFHMYNQYFLCNKGNMSLEKKNVNFINLLLFTLWHRVLFLKI